MKNNETQAESAWNCKTFINTLISTSKVNKFEEDIHSRFNQQIGKFPFIAEVTYPFVFSEKSHRFTEKVWRVVVP